jgi:hypothetical protein
MVSSKAFASTDMKWTIVVMCILAFIPIASGQTTSTYDTGVGHGQPLIPTAQSKLPDTLSPVAVDWHYAEGMLTLHLVNNSNKDITAYNISISRKYADGSADTPGSSEMTEELLGGFIYSQMARDGERREDGTFAAGTSRYQHMPETKDVVDVTAVVDVVLFADATAFVQNERGFKRMMAFRQGELMAMRKVDEIIRRALDSTSTSPASAALAELTPLLVDTMGRNHAPDDPEQNQETELRSGIDHLKNVRQVKVSEREYLTRYAEELEKRIELMKPHANVSVNLVEVR